jgi:hypothetical protein
MADLRKAKDRRMKIIAGVGLVLLAAVLAYEMPKALHHGGASSAPPPATTTTGATSTAPATTAPGTAAAASLPTASASLPNSDVLPRRSRAELFSFSQFDGKNPFVQQVVATTQGVPSSTGSGSSNSSSSAPSGTSSGGSGSSATSYRTSHTSVAAGTATISVNGKIQTVQIGASFPSANPLFRLVSIFHGTARIGLTHGRFTSGARTMALTPGGTLTLVDTADGKRYKIRLLSAS